MLSKARSRKSQPNVSDHDVSELGRVNSTYVLSAASIMLVIVTALLVVYRLNPPGPAGINAPLTEFSGERALKHLTILEGERYSKLIQAEHRVTTVRDATLGIHGTPTATSS